MRQWSCLQFLDQLTGFVVSPGRAIAVGIQSLDPAIGAIVFFYLKDFAGKAAEYWPAIVGCALVIATPTIPSGIMGVVQDITRRWRGGR